MRSAMVHIYMLYIPNWSVQETEYLQKKILSDIHFILFMYLFDMSAGQKQ